MGSKVEENTIEELAQQFFADTNSLQKRDKFFVALYNSTLVKSIILKNIQKYENLLTAYDLKYDLKQDCFIKSVERSLKLYNPEKGPFINYFSRSFKFDCINWLNKKTKLEKTEVSSEPINGTEEEPSELENLADEKTDAPDESLIKSEKKNEFDKELFKTVNAFFLKRKSGQKNKSAAYTFCVLKELLFLPSKEKLTATIITYDFLKPQQTLIISLWDNYQTNHFIPNAKTFSKLTGVPESKISGFNTELKSAIKQ